MWSTDTKKNVGEAIIYKLFTSKSNQVYFDTTYISQKDELGVFTRQLLV